MKNDPICQKFAQDDRLRLKGLNTIIEGETYHYCYPDASPDDERYK